MEHVKTIYRVAVSGLHCRSSVEFVNLKVRALEGVEATSISPDHTLTVFADAGLVSPDDLIRVLVDAGVTPNGDVTTFAHAETVAASVPEVAETPAVALSPRAAIVQRINVAVSDTYYPSRIEVIPGIPVEIEFGEGHGCLANVIFEQFGIDRDLTQGGATVRLPGLAPGEYQFSCGMHMVFGTVVAAA